MPAAARAGSLIVAAAGNDGDTTISYPAGLAQVVSVAAIGPGRPRRAVLATRTRTSRWRPRASMCCPRGAVAATCAESGTSMATPHVHGRRVAAVGGATPRVSAANIRAPARRRRWTTSAPQVATPPTASASSTSRRRSESPPAPRVRRELQLPPRAPGATPPATPARAGHYASRYPRARRALRLPLPPRAPGTTPPAPPARAGHYASRSPAGVTRRR